MLDKKGIHIQESVAEVTIVKKEPIPVLLFQVNSQHKFHLQITNKAMISSKW